MRAAWYERQGPADEVLQIGELPAPRPAPGEVRVRLTYSGVNPGDTKKRRGWLGSAMPYATRHDRPGFPFWPMLFDNVTIRLLGSDDFPVPARQQAAADLTTAARDRALSIAIGPALPLAQVAEAHDRVDAGARDRVLLTIPQ